MKTTLWTNPKTNETMTEEQYKARIKEFAQSLIEQGIIVTLEDYLAGKGNCKSFYKLFMTPKEFVLKLYDDYVMDMATRQFYKQNGRFYKHVEQ